MPSGPLDSIRSPSVHPNIWLAVLSAGALAGCSVLVDRYDSTSQNFTAEYESELELALARGQAAEYCAVFGQTADLARSELVDGDPHAVFDCR